MEWQEARALKCPMCDTDFLAQDILDGDGIVTCPACSRQFSVNDVLHKSKEEIIEEMRTKVEEQKIELEHEKMRNELAKEEREAQRKDVHDFMKSGFRIVLIIAGIISALLCGTAFHDGKIFAGLVTLLMVGCFVGSFLMGINFIPEWRKGFRVIPAIIGFLLFIPATELYNNGKDYSSDKKIEWSNIVLSNIIPEPSSSYGSIITNDEDGLYITIYNIKEKDYKEYINACKSMGYTIDAKVDSNSYEAYNNDGYLLSLSCFSGEQYTIDLEAPKKRNPIQWNKIAIMGELPTPKTSIGEITSESATFFCVYIADTTKSMYDAYVQACIEKGFNIDYSKGDTWLNAKNEAGYVLRLEYKGRNTMFLRIELRDK